MKLFARIFKTPFVIALAMAAITFAPNLMAADGGHGPAPGEIGDHHAPTDQHEMLHFSGSLMFWEYLTFGIVLVVLGVYIFPKLLGQLKARQDRIQDALDKADRVRAEAEVLLRKHEEMMRNAHADAKKITDEATHAAREAAARIQADADKAAAETRERAEKEVDQLARKARAELRDQAVELALLASSRVLQKSLQDEDHRRLAQEVITAAGTMND
ncbi:MAG: F0F1 ATP synthase subunit B [Planctomycetes bacterium]|nr:F0F1 ATP synthase subunit B [Planctomycetota bacterium]MCA8935990.1 F0F1 ATP synthase subunit B [Planctomycetota bacterium]